ncbi:hypothetical protein [Roseobacter sp. EG26]|uniref:hypothetical protein n=1 Tax=Roseobacter sp. EG26 TaxID=3412477 RepID=UPI003CE5509F
MSVPAGLILEHPVDRFTFFLALHLAGKHRSLGILTSQKVDRTFGSQGKNSRQPPSNWAHQATKDSGVPRRYQAH